MTNAATKALAERLARKLIGLGDELTPCHRIQFKCGIYPDYETSGGGMNEEALIDFFARVLSADPVAVGGRKTLSKEQIDFIISDSFLSANGSIYSTRVYDFVRAIEAAHGIHPTPKARETPVVKDSLTGGSKAGEPG